MIYGMFYVTQSAHNSYVQNVTAEFITIGGPSKYADSWAAGGLSQNTDELL